LLSGGDAKIQPFADIRFGRVSYRKVAWKIRALCLGFSLFAGLQMGGAQGKKGRRGSTLPASRETCQVADIFQEVDEEVRQDKLNRLWKKYAPVLIGLAVLVVLATAGITGWRQYVNNEREKASDALIAAMSQAASGDRAGAINALDALSVDAREPDATLARLRAAGLRAESGDAKAAAFQYAEIARTASDNDIRQLAEVLAGIQAVSAESLDAGIAKLKPLADTGGPWHNVAREYLAYLTFKKGDVAQAQAIWRQISQDAEASEALKARAAELLAATGAAPVTPAAPAAVSPAPPAAAPPAPPATPDTKGK
jgi:hypothetical protein